MPARDQKHKIWRTYGIGQTRRQRMAFKMIDGEKRFGRSERESLAGDGADNQSADEARTGCCGDSIDVGQPDTGFVQSRGNNLIQALAMSARGNLRHDAAVRLMGLKLRPDDIRQDAATAVVAAFDHRCRRFIAARLDAEHQQRTCGFIMLRSHAILGSPEVGKRLTFSH